MKFQLTMLIIAGCTGDNVIEKQDNSAPIINITSHGETNEIQEGFLEQFRAQVSDENHDFEELQIAWYVDEELVCDWNIADPAGSSTCEIVFNPDDSNVIAEVRDSQGAGGRAEVSVSIIPTEAPIAELVSPIQGHNYYSNQLIQFSAIISDLEDDATELISIWSSNTDGELPIDTEADSSGEISGFGYLSEGQHAIELRVEDTTGKTTSEEVVILVGGENSLPICSILEPFEDSGFVLGSVITFRATADDIDIPNSQLAIDWSSDKDGSFGTNSATSSGEIVYAYDALSANTHTITLTVTDEVGSICSDAILISVGTAPSVTIDTPQNNDVYSIDESITFLGQISDSEDIPNNLTVSWNSSIDGELSTQSPTSQGISQFSIANLNAGVHSITLTATDSDGLTADDLITFRVNTPPPSPTLSILPSIATSVDTITAAVTPIADADGDNVTFSYEWLENGVVTSNVTASVPSSELDVGEIWTIRVTPNDGYVDGTYAEESITISNSNPQISNVQISPSNTVYNDDILTCTATATDADETVSATFEWNVNGTITNGTTLDLSNTNAAPTDVIVCTAEVTDSLGATASANTTIGLDNRSPIISGTAITPNTGVSTNSSLVCNSTITDPDGETLTANYQWNVGGNSIASGSTLQLTPTLVSPNDTLECLVTASDGYGSTTTDSTSVVIDNTAPILSNISLSPAQPTATDTLTCSASATDIDGDIPTLSFSFSSITTGTSYSASSSSTTSSSLDLSILSVLANEEIQCTITATDSLGLTDSSSVSVTIINTAPEFSVNATITPSPVYTGDTLTCSATVSDPDDGPLSPLYVWSLNGNTLATGTTYIVSSVDTDVGDQITCSAIATDSDGESTTSVVSETIQNTTPTLSSTTIQPSLVYNDSSLSCSTVITDPDETLSATYTWSVAGINVGSGSTIDLATTAAQYQDQVECTAFVIDSNGSIDTEIATATVENRAPSSPTITITPTTPVEAIDPITCSISVASVDNDGDSISYTFSWTLNGTPYNSATNSPTSSIVPASATIASDIWECSVTPNDGIEDGIVATSTVQITSPWSGTREFTNCTQTGKHGPDQSQCDSNYSGSTLDGEVVVSGGIQEWVVPYTGTYQIEAWGARAGHKPDSYNAIGGNGARMQGEFQLTQGDIIYILVGQMGSDPSGNNSSGGSGGGGGSFVFYDANDQTPLLASGGGGGLGAGNGLREDGLPGLTGTSGGDASSSEGLGGTNGSGGQTSSANYNSGGGGGWLSNGADGSHPDHCEGGFAPRNGGAGGDRGRISHSADGGFGGGGGTNDGGGGGGGYSGGGGGRWSPLYPGGGGGSYNQGNNQDNQTDFNNDHGRVFIELL
jgi:hypothetical protein